MITELTQTQLEHVPKWVNQWRDIFTEIKPFDNSDSSDIVEKVYKFAGFTKPKHIIWCKSPLSLLFITYILKEVLNLESIAKQIEKNIAERVKSEQKNYLAKKVQTQLKNRIDDSLENTSVQLSPDFFTRIIFDNLREIENNNSSIWDVMPKHVRSTVWSSVNSIVGSSQWGKIRSLSDQSLTSLLSYSEGICDVNDFVSWQLYKTKSKAKLSFLWDLAQISSWWIPCKDICLLSENFKTINLDEQSRLHCEDDYALEFADGWGLYRWHGVNVPEQLILRPHDLTIEDIDNETNQEIRRIKIERYGQEKYLLDSMVEIIDQDDFGTLYKKDLDRDEPIVMVKVVNSTPEKDGSYKDYFIRVPPVIKSAKEAVAWTFNLTKEEYSPTIET